MNGDGQKLLVTKVHEINRTPKSGIISPIFQGHHNNCVTVQAKPLPNFSQPLLPSSSLIFDPSISDLRFFTLSVQRPITRLKPPKGPPKDPPPIPPKDPDPPEPPPPPPNNVAALFQKLNFLSFWGWQF